MQFQFLTSRRRLGALLLLGAACVAPPVHAQNHEKSAHGYTLRSNLAPTTALPGKMLKDQGIEAGPNRALLEVVVLKNQKGVKPTVPADVKATVTTLSDSRRSIEPHPESANGRTSYLGVIEHASREVLDIKIEATPEGSEHQITLKYRDRTAR